MTINEIAKTFSSNPLNGKTVNPPLIPIKGNRSDPQTGHPDANAPANAPVNVPLPDKELSLITPTFILILCKIMETFKPNKIDIIKLDIKVK